MNDVAAVFDLSISPDVLRKLQNDHHNFEITSDTTISLDNGETRIRFQDYLDSSIKAIESSFVNGVSIDICRPGLQIEIGGYWVPCEKLPITLKDILKKYFLKYITPDEYSHLIDHVRGTAVPLHLALKNVGLRLDESFVELPGEPLIFPGFWLQVEETSIVELAQNTPG